MNTEVLRIIEGGLANDHRKIISYANRLADRLDKEGESPLAKCIRQKLETSVPHSAAIADALRTIPLDSDSRLQIVEVVPSVAKTEHSHPLGMVVSTHFRCGKGVKRGLKNGALPFNID